MIDYWLPGWFVKFEEKYSGNRMLTDIELGELRRQLKRFEVENPLVSICIPAWNEEENILRTIASLADNEFGFPCELIVVNNNSTDHTQALLNDLGIRSFLEMNQGIAHARRRGLLESKGKYHLCCDSDTVYPPEWIKTMTDALQKNEENGVACVYGSYSFIPSSVNGRLVMAVYETATSIIRMFKSKKTEALRVLGFNFGFIREIAIQVNGFKMDNPRKFRNEFGSAGYVYRSEDGIMASHIKKAGYKLLFINNRKSRAWTSDRRLIIDGGLMRATAHRLIKLFTAKKL
jgi:glycosyltransferase involved in cell wall biosynthesis